MQLDIITSNYGLVCVLFNDNCTLLLLFTIVFGYKHQEQLMKNFEFNFFARSSQFQKGKQLNSFGLFVNYCCSKRPLNHKNHQETKI